MLAISIIIPVFNAELHLEKCIDSLLNQTLSSCEFIFVNDGSTDNSQIIIENYKNSNDTIKLINQENQGVSKARNNGLLIAKGDYVGFVDADDYIENDYFETLYSKAKSNNLDIVICNFFSTNEGVNSISKNYFAENEVFNKNFIQQEIIPHLIGSDTLNAIWNKIYKRTLITNSTICFPNGIALGEDGLFNLDCFSKASTICFLDYAGYHYVEVSGSATRDFATKNYFYQIEKEYNYDYSKFENSFLKLEKIEFLKAQKYCNKIISLLHEYYKTYNNLNKNQRYKLVKEIINSKTTIKIVKTYYKILFLQKSKYEQVILFGIKYKFPIIISTAIAYSNFRNKK